MTNRNRTALALVAALTACKGGKTSFHSIGADDQTVVREERDRAMNGAALSGVLGQTANAAAPAAPPVTPEPEKQTPGTPAAHRAGGGQQKTETQEADGESLEGFKDKKPDAPSAETATRAWFPETFLFEPLVVTDANGIATVPVRVPDRLTSWHVLALAHSRGGAQAGAETSFVGTLPTYVDPIIPKTLVIGDQIRLPIQLVNTTTAAVTAPLTIAVRGATVTGGTGTHTIPAQSSVVVYATLTADHAGTVAIEVTLAGADAVKRTLEVVPSGRPIVTTRSGTLAAPRTLDIIGPAGSDPATDRVRLLAFPGALALLRSELGAATDRSSVADDAYALLLAGKASALLTALGDAADPEALRALAITTSQRAIRDGRTLDVTSATLLAEAALAHPANPVLVRLGERAADYLATAQRPDGTFGGGTGWTLQRVLVTTADATRAVGSANGAAFDTAARDHQRALEVAARATGAFERNLVRVDDGYTAAAILASGALGPTSATVATVEALRAKVRDAIVAAADGSKYLAVPAGVVRADGIAPSVVEATALAVLALTGDPKAPLADLGATLLGAYTQDRGWGDGNANLVAMRAVVQLFKDPVPANVHITLTVDGKPVTDGTLSAAKLREVLAMEAPAAGIAGPHTWAITAEPAVAGLGFSLALESWVAWETEAAHDGLELALPKAVTGAVGKPIAMTVTAVAPSGRELHLQEALPAGMQVDRPSLDALVSASTIERYEVADGKLDLYVGALQPGKTFAASYTLIPTLAGTLHAAASTIELLGADTEAASFHVPPTTWTIK